MMLLIFHSIVIALIIILIIWLDAEREYYKASFKIADDAFYRAMEQNRRILDNVHHLERENNES